MRKEMKRIEGFQGQKIDPLKIKKKEKKLIEKPIFNDTENIIDEFDEDSEGGNKKSKKSGKGSHNMWDEFTEEDELEFQRKK